MDNILKRNIAPITKEAWAEIDDMARSILKDHLTARSIVDFAGPHGVNYSGVNLGMLKVFSSEPIPGVKWGLRQIQPLVEIRVPFSLNIWELDNINRGHKNPDLGSLEEAAKKVAHFEEKAIYHGFKEGQISGMIDASPHTPLTLPASTDGFQDVVEEAIATVRSSGISGPYNLILGFEPYKQLLKEKECGYPMYQRIKTLLGGHILLSFGIEGGVLMSARGGDFEINVGQDISIGYQSHTAETIELYFSESFTFQVLTPEAAVGLNPSKK